MSDAEQSRATDWARSFGSVADAYDRGRPSYPAEAVAWLVGNDPLTVLELGAGTGKLTAGLLAAGHDVHATDPDAEMLAVLRRELPDVPASVAPAEEVPLPDRSVDVVVCAQAFHWFDHDRALAEIARVLRPRGRLALVWNRRDERIPWVRRLGRLIGNQDQLQGLAEPVVQSPLFGFVEDATFRFWQTVDRESIQDLVLSRSNIAALDEDARAAKLAEVLEFYDEYGRGMDGMQLPYEACCFRASLVDDERAPDTTGHEQASTPAPAEGCEISDGTDTDMLLIDFH